MSYILTIYKRDNNYFTSVDLKYRYAHVLHDGFKGYLSKDISDYKQLIDENIKLDHIIWDARKTKIPEAVIKTLFLDMGYVEPKEYTYQEYKLKDEEKPNKYLMKYGLSMHAMEQISGVSTRTLSNWYHGDKRGTFETLLTGCLAERKNLTNDDIMNY